MVGRRIWVLDTYAGQVLTSGPFKVQSFKQFLPAGRFRRMRLDNKGHGVLVEEVSERKRSLVQLWTDGGMRTVAVATIWTKDPGKSSTPW